MKIKTEAWLSDPEYWLFVFRLKSYVEANKTGSDLLDAAMEGRQKSPEAVLKILEVVVRHFGSGKIFDHFYNAALEYLLRSGVSDAQKVLAKRLLPPKLSVVPD